MSHLDLGPAATANFVVHATWASARAQGARVLSSDELTLVDSGLDTDTFNIVCAARLEPGRVAAAVSRVFEHFSHARRPFSWWVAPGDRPDDLGARLEAEGLKPAETELAMSLDLPAGRTPAVSPVPGLRVELAGNRRTLEDFARINAENWSPPEEKVLAFYRRSAEDLLTPRAPQAFHVAYLAGEAVAAVEITLAAGVAGVYNLSTRAPHRNRGIASHLLRSALDAAEAQGAHTAVLQAAPAGIGLYRRMGFAEFGKISEHKPAAV